MQLYKKNYTILTPEDQAQLEKNRAEQNFKIGDNNFDCRITNNLVFTKGLRHYDSLFPNNFLDPVELKNITRLDQLNSEFNALINNEETKESDVLKFIKVKKAYHIIGSILCDNYEFGHHSAYLFPEFDLTSSYKADYLLVGRGSGGHQFVFIELEEVYGQITVKDGSPGLAIRKGLKQIEEWDEWLDANFQSLKIIFDKHKKEDDSLPNEFISLDKSRIHFAIVAGRRNDFTDKTYRLRRKMLHESKVRIFHFDNLIDFSSNIKGNKTY